MLHAIERELPLPSGVPLQRSNVKPMLLSALLGTGNHYVDFFDEEMLNVGFHGWLRWPPNGICVNAQPLLWFQETPRKILLAAAGKATAACVDGRRSCRSGCLNMPIRSCAHHTYPGAVNAPTHWVCRLPSTHELVRPSSLPVAGRERPGCAAVTAPPPHFLPAPAASPTGRLIEGQ